MPSRRNRHRGLSLAHFDQDIGERRACEYGLSLDFESMALQQAHPGRATAKVELLAPIAAA